LHLLVDSQRTALSAQPRFLLNPHLPVPLNHLGVNFRNEMFTEEGFESFADAVDRLVALLELPSRQE